MQDETTIIEESKALHEVRDIMGERGGIVAGAGLYGILNMLGSLCSRFTGASKQCHFCSAVGYGEQGSGEGRVVLLFLVLLEVTLVPTS